MSCITNCFGVSGPNANLTSENVSMDNAPDVFDSKDGEAYIYNPLKPMDKGERSGNKS
ncbi:hypothetical protein IWW55_003249 [Coemansia sp. RSA 2706]|nr:hypothetical protein IWW55_003249 [Coemansia sp. RSA 2706]KAJ2391899.1 hypothetical protein H4S02_001080 [Coemansia sp. RSA 2611]